MKEVEFQADILDALKSSPNYTISGRYGRWVGVKNPWQTPTRIVQNGALIVELPDADSWMVAPRGFFGMPHIDVYSSAAWSEVAVADPDEQDSLAATPQEAASSAVPEPPQEIQWNQPPLSASINGANSMENSKKSSSVVLGGVGLAASFLIPVGGIIVSAIGLRKAQKEGNTTGKGLSVAGVIVGSILTILGILFFIAIAGFGSLGSSLGGSTSDSKTVPAWWASDNEKLLSTLQSVDEGWENIELDSQCSYSYLFGAYENFAVATPENELRDKAFLYESALRERFPDADLSVGTSTTYDGEPTYKVELSSGRDDSYNPTSAAFELEITTEFIMGSSSASCRIY